MRSRQNTISCVQYSSARYYDTAACETGLGARWSARYSWQPFLLSLFSSSITPLPFFPLLFSPTLLRPKRISIQLVVFQAFLPFVIFPVLLSKPKSFTALSSCARWTYQNSGSVIREVKLHSFIFSVLFLRYWGEGAVGLDVPR